MNPLRKFVVFVIFFFSITSHLLAHDERSAIKGTVTGTNGKPIADINITLRGTKYGSATNVNGYYEISRVPAGNYVFVATGIGYQAEEKNITVEEGETLTIHVTLSHSKEELQEIVVSSSKINKFTRPSSEYVAKIPIKNIENPQVYNSISSEVLADQVITSFDEIFKNAPGIYKLWESTGRGGDGAGYYSLRGFPVQPTMVNGLPSLTNGSPDPSNIAQVEIIKGPSGTLYGSSLISYGGLINVVTEKPYESLGGEVSYKTGSFGLNRVTADVNTPVADNFFLRVNGAYEKQNSFQNAGFSESFFIAPSLRYKANEDLSFVVNTEFYRPESTNPLLLFLNRSDPLEAHNLDELDYDRNLSYTTNDITIKNPTFSLQARMNYQISDEWRSQTAISRSSAQSDGYYSYVSTIGLPENTYGRYFSDQNSTSLGTDIQQNFIGDFELAGISNKMVIGFDFLQQNLINNSSGYIKYDEIDLQDSNPSAISKAAVDTMLASAPVNNIKTRQQTYSAYALDVIEFLPRLSAMVSLRVDHFVNDGNLSTGDDDYNQTTLSPKFGLVFQPVRDKVSLFANYMNGFSNVAPRTQGDGSVKTFEPEHANQWEVGIKTDLYDGRITTTLSYYDINVSNIVRQDPDRINFFVQNGEQYSRGFEASLTAAPLRGLNLIAGYSYNESDVVTTSSAYFDIQGRRPEYAGPKHLANLWASYQFTGNPLEGLGLGVGGNYTSEYKLVNRPSTGAFTLPSYTVLNASVFYNARSFRLDLKVNNITNVDHYKGGWTTVIPQPKRNVTASFSYKF